MNKTSSSYFDFIRFFAAMIVLLFHASYENRYGEWLSAFSKYGHDAVIIFFVLSGFVISYVGATREKTANDFFLSRFARLYSVVLPALIITLLADYIGKSIDPSVYVTPYYRDSDPLWRFFSNALFVNELWFESIRPFSNGPFWSLSYEFWYYVIFAAFWYSKGFWRYLLPTLAALIAGPKILLLMPIWLMGCFLFFKVSAIERINPRIALAMVVVPLILFFMLKTYGIDKQLLKLNYELFGKAYTKKMLKFSKKFWFDYLTGILFTIHLAGAIALSRHYTMPELLTRVFTYLASFSFSLYLFHYPLLMMWSRIVDIGPLVVGLTLITIMLVAPFTEGKKSDLKRWLKPLFLR